MFKHLYKIVKFTGIVLLLSACSSKHELVPSPNIYTKNATYPKHFMSHNTQTIKPKILYMTDRKKEEHNQSISYGTTRSSSMAFGEVTVSFENVSSWESLAKQSALKRREHTVNLKIDNIKEFVHFPSTPLPFNAKNPKKRSSQQILYANKTKEFQKILAAKLSKSKQKDVVIFVHGFNNTYEDAALSLTELWHFSGRAGVPLFYTWAAGNSGLLSYFVDRESGEFSIFHLKETIKMIASMPEVKHIHLIAHSRGTDVLTTALRELIIAQRAKGNNPQKTLKIKNLILAAPDLDFGVVSQRLIAEKFGLAFGQITVYMNKGDSALNISQYLMSGTRFGRIDTENLTKDEKSVFAQVKNVNFIEVESVSGLIGHAYFRENPGVLSDIATIIQTSSFPGTKKRPLENKTGNFWLLQKGYPF